MSEPILIPIKASEELPKEKGWYHVICDDKNEDMAYFHNDNSFAQLAVWGYHDSEIKIWYKPVLEDEYKKEIIIDLLNNHLDTWEYANCGNVEEVAQEYINYIKSKLTEK